MEVHNALVQSLHEGQDTGLIILDQSKAYEIIQHDILIEKLRIVGFQDNSIEIMKSFLGDRKQYVQVQNMKSETLMLGSNSVIQGSMMSGVLFLLYILDMPYLLRSEIEPPKEYRQNN